ncbi:MAG: ABC transporter ATP-binding protein [Candidatus Hydrogenedentes bacterium]|nr:ABC transporter ATP-binding protein [Candidatus Hydrogenedentota bacterium]
MSSILSVNDLRTYFRTESGNALAVDGVSFEVSAGKTLALVGESGCGKTVTALSLMGLVPRPPGYYPSGEVLFEGRDLLRLPLRELRKIRGNRITMIFQEPMTSMNPVFRIGSQMGAAIRQHRNVSRAEARKRSIELLDKVGIPAPDERIDDYPHQLSGGMLQRVMIAMALACDPALLIADEPTTALDVTIQAQILELLRQLQSETGMAILLITHDLGIVAEMADEVAVMYAGKIVEHAPTKALFAKRMHPYTQGLFESLPSMHQRGARLHTIKGIVPPATRFPEGCRFHPRCPHVMQACRENAPGLRETHEDHCVACWLHDTTQKTEIRSARAGS